MAQKPSEKEMDDWFKLFDADNSGKVDGTELKAVVKAFYEWQQLPVDDAKINADVAVTRRCTYLGPLKAKIHYAIQFVSWFASCCATC